MAERVISPVTDKDPMDMPEIDSVGMISFKVNKTDNGDLFARSAEEVKALDGIDSVFKGKITRSMTKFRRGIDGAESKQIHEDKEFLTGYDTLEVVEPEYNMEYLAKIYELSAPHYAAINAKVANIVGLGFNFVETRKTKKALEAAADNEKKSKKIREALDDHRYDLMEMLDSFNEEDSFTETLIKVWRDYEVTGNGYIEVGRKKDGSVGYIGHIPAQTMRIRRKRDGFVQMTGWKVQFFANYGQSEERNPIGGGRPNEVIHLKRYSPTSGYYGVPDVVAAKHAIAGDEFAARFNLDYFEHKAVPRYVIVTKGAKLGSRAEADMLSFFETGLKGKHHRSLYIPMPSGTKEEPVDIKFEAIESGVQDASFINYHRSNRSDILMAHRVPESKISISGGASVAVARDADKTFKEQVCAPEQRIAENKVNKIIKELTDAYEFKLNEMTLTDADTQSKIDERYVKTGVKVPNEIRANLGMGGIPGGNERVDLNAKAKEMQTENTTNRERDASRSANGTDSNGESRNPKGEGRTEGTG
jgi:PBSX family phage portal protein